VQYIFQLSHYSSDKLDTAKSSGEFVMKMWFVIKMFVMKMGFVMKTECDEKNAIC